MYIAGLRAVARLALRTITIPLLAVMLVLATVLLGLTRALQWAWRECVE